ncbi:hypothetical protein H0H92_001703 [Tricholoma furcatifolium]|nr:hypothetical protein H0H92_001703 [Tricholoma furcatifolium]
MSPFELGWLQRIQRFLTYSEAKWQADPSSYRYKEANNKYTEYKSGKSKEVNSEVSPQRTGKLWRHTILIFPLAKALVDLFDKEDDNELLAHRINPDWTEDIIPKAFDKPQMWRMVQTSATGTDLEEAVFTMYGFVTQVDFPPLSFDPKFCFYKQSVEISGMGTKGFKDTVDFLDAVYQRFDRLFKASQLEAWTQGSDLLVFSNKYAIMAKDALVADIHIPFTSLEDPAGIMQHINQEGFVRTDDNVVQYLSTKTNMDLDTEHVNRNAICVHGLH